MAFPVTIVEEALLACGRFCCLCHKYCGNKIETHHIEQNRDDTFENCIPLCFDCHAEVGSYNTEHPKGRKFTAAELKGHRNRWYQLIKEGRHLSLSASLPDEKVMLKYEFRNVAEDDFAVFAVEVVNTGTHPLYIKKVVLGWRFHEDEKNRHSYLFLSSKEEWKTALPPGMSREYKTPLDQILSSHGDPTKPMREYDDVWISVETPKGEIQKVIELQRMFSPRVMNLLPMSARLHIPGRPLYPT